MVNHVYFSPDGQWLASASFDKSVKLWNGITGKFAAAFRGHVADVYQIRSAANLFSTFLVSHQLHTYLMPNIVFIIMSFSFSWSADSRLLLSGSKDSTLKVYSATFNMPMYNLECFFFYVSVGIAHLIIFREDGHSADACIFCFDPSFRCGTSGRAS